MKDIKEVTWKSLHPGDKIKGWREGSVTHYNEATVVATNVSNVTVLVFDKYEERIDSETSVFFVILTDDEYRAKYQDAARDVVRSLHNKLSEYECGYHEMWNSWIDIDPFKIGKACKENDMQVVGFIKLSAPKTSYFGTALDAGICCEYSTGERFWCHTSLSLIDRIVDKYSYLLKEHS